MEFNKMKKILITGASGFVGSALIKELQKCGHVVRGAIRKKNASLAYKSKVDYVFIDDINAFTEWSNALSGIDTIIHCAALSNINKLTDRDTLSKYREVNVSGTKRLAEQAVKLDVRRIILLSTVKVYGEFTVESKKFSKDDQIAPKSEYGISKYEAEEVLKQVSAKTDLEVVIVRSPIVYGAGTTGNFLRLMNLIKSRVPIPLNSIQNKRSFIGIDNLVDFLIVCNNETSAAGQTFLISDNQDLSTTEVIHKIAIQMGKKPLLFSVPIFILKAIGYILRKSTDIDRLISSLQIDINHTCKILKWTPPFSVEDGFKKMVDSYIEKQGK